MARHTTFRFCLDPTVEQSVVLARNVGAARFAYNQCLRLHLDARTARGSQVSTTDGGGGGGSVDGGGVAAGGEGAAAGVPWSRFALINVFNQWKRSEEAGRRFLVAGDGATGVEVTGLVWRGEVSSQVFEEAAVDLARALAAWTASRSGKRKGRPVGHPRFKRKNHAGGSFRMRNNSSHGRARIRIGDGDRARSVSLPKIGVLRVRECTRRLRRMIITGRARILHVTVSRGANRWWISITVEAADLHPAMRHTPRPADPSTQTDGTTDDPEHDEQGWVGVDRGLRALAVAGSSDGLEVLRVENQRVLRRGLPRLRRLSKAVTRKKKGSRNRRKAVVRLGRQHARIRDRRRHALHQVSNQLVKNHARLVLEDLNITGMTKNRKLSRAISDAAWGELARQITYKQTWCDGQVLLADRWFPSSKTCSSCGNLRKDLTLKDRTFECRECGLVMDRDLNAAVNLAAWAENHTPPVTNGGGRGVAQVGDRQAAGPVTNAHRRDNPTHSGSRGWGGKGPDDVGTRSQTAPVA